MPQTRVTDKKGKSAKWQRRSRGIVDASAKVFAERGYHATSTTELCGANGIGKGALDYYIGSKEELLAAVHARVMDEVMLGADRVDLAGGTPWERLAMLGEELLDVIFRFPDHVWVFLHDFPALTGTNAEMFQQRRRACEQRVEAVFRHGVESGDLPAAGYPARGRRLARHAQLHLPVAASGRAFLGEGRGQVVRRHLRLGHRHQRAEPDGRPACPLRRPLPGHSLNRRTLPTLVLGRASIRCQSRGRAAAARLCSDHCARSLMAGGCSWSRGTT